jgi:hypothetical protein
MAVIELATRSTGVATRCAVTTTSGSVDWAVSSARTIAGKTSVAQNVAIAPACASAAATRSRSGALGAGREARGAVARVVASGRSVFAFAIADPFR